MKGWAMDDSASDDDDITMLMMPPVWGYLVRIESSGNHCTPFILTKPNTTIGRKKNNDITLTDATISSNHAEIEIDSANKQAFIIDLASTNKTRVGPLLPSATQSNKIVKANRQIILKSGDYATFGDVHFIFYHKEDYDEYQSQQQIEKVKSIYTQRIAKGLNYISTENSAEDGDGDILYIEMKTNCSLSPILASRGKKNALCGKKRTVQQRDEEEDHNAHNSNTNSFKPPPAKRPRRGRIAKRLQQSDDGNNTNKKKKSPNRRKRTHIIPSCPPNTQCSNKRTLINVDESRFNLRESFERKEPLFDGYKVYFSSEHKRNVKKAIGAMAQSRGTALMHMSKSSAKNEIDENRYTYCLTILYIFIFVSFLIWMDM